MRALFATVVLLAQLSPAACTRPTDRATSSQGPTPSPASSPESNAVELTAVELHKVRLDSPHKLRDENGTERAYEQAWLVTLSFRNRPPVRDVGMDLFVGDYRVPEYGGLKDGIYFRIYEDRLLQSLDGQEISVGFEGKKLKSLGKRLSTQGYAELPVKEEKAVLKR